MTRTAMNRTMDRLRRDRRREELQKEADENFEFYQRAEEPETKPEQSSDENNDSKSNG